MNTLSFNLFILLLFLMLPNHFYGQQNTTLSLQLQTKSITERAKDTVLNLEIRGSVPPLSWVKGIPLTDTNTDGIYTVCLDFEITENTDVYFKYALNGFEWEAEDARKITLKPGGTHNFSHDFQYIKRPRNPFKKFVGKWTLKDDLWQQGNTEETITTLKIPGHITTCQEVNTDTSILCVIEATSAKGHVLWGYNHDTQKIQHLSNFLPFRNGVGDGRFSKNGDIQLKVSFQGEPEGTYRVYNYIWINENEYLLESNQFDANDQPTGNFYGGTFVRIDQSSSLSMVHPKDTSEVKTIFKTLDDNTLKASEKLNVWIDDLVHMAPDNDVITAKEQLRTYLEKQNTYGNVVMQHQIVDLYSYPEIAIVRGKVTGTFTSKDTSNTVPFETKNLFVFKRQEDHSLKIWKVIYNHSPIKTQTK
ncbi:hypothetical protein [Aquimarina spongiae]|uniref:Uncharacterized protein n=1 Tax=Aquimarina spongiae TaxID=570521 RepID=A0A1M6ELL5_9FLAO|nr:hypothetical protein [Aquimarina spongiae]SHI86391.1 hypothetical protein SAMN04488508_103469 [Aquimarina spongiae]